MAPSGRARTDVIRMWLFITVVSTVLFNWQSEKTSSAQCCRHVLMWAIALYVRQNISGADKDVIFLEQLMYRIMPVDTDVRLLWFLKIRAAALKGMIQKFAKISARESIML